MEKDGGMWNGIPVLGRMVCHVSGEVQVNRAGGSTTDWVGVRGAHPSKTATDEGAAVGVVRRLGQSANGITWHRQNKEMRNARRSQQKVSRRNGVSRSIER